MSITQVRIEASLVGRVDAWRQRQATALPGYNISRQAALAQLLAYALDEEERAVRRAEIMHPRLKKEEGAE